MALVGGWWGEPHQLRQRACPRLMHRRSHGHLDGLHIQESSLTAALKDNAQQPVYFARSCFMNRSNRFFSSAVHALFGGATGRCRQIFSLTVISSLPNCWKR